MDGADDQEVWHVTHRDRKIFLRSAKLHHSLPDDPLNQNNEGSNAHQCMNTLHSIVQSLQYDHVMVTEKMAFHKNLWDIKVYEDNPITFPVLHVPIKCNVLSTMIHLLRKIPNGGSSVDSVDKILPVFEYLEKLLDATKFPTHLSSGDGSASSTSSDESVSSKRWSTHSLFSSAKRSSSILKSKRSSQVPTQSTNTAPMTISTTIPNPYPKRIPIETRAKHGHTFKENVKKFQEYKPLIIALYHKLRLLDRGNPKNDFIFQFIQNSVCKFIIEDCKSILIDYVERRIIQSEPQTPFAPT